MLCLGPKKSLTSPRLELTAQGVAFRCSKLSVKTTRLSRRPGKEVVYCCNVTLLSVLLASPFLCINGGGGDSRSKHSTFCALRKILFYKGGPSLPVHVVTTDCGESENDFFLAISVFQSACFARPGRRRSSCSAMTAHSYGKNKRIITCFVTGSLTVGNFFKIYDQYMFLSR